MELTPEEKAKELIWKYLPILQGWTDPEKTKLAKQCALISIDEIIGLGFLTNGRDHERIQVSQVYYWEEVKTEINLL